MKRGINLGCGRVILPCAQPEHHTLIPANLYTDPDIAWDNADKVRGAGVNKVVDLFDYPWAGLDDNTYDVAILSHIAEHIPHHIVWQGKFVHDHPAYQEGWFAFFGELWRIMKPGGKAHVLTPYGFSNGGISDPTHTRYLTPASFNYFHAPDNGSPFEYKMGAQRWSVRLDQFMYTPHEAALKQAEALYTLTHGALQMLSVGKEPIVLPEMDWGLAVNRLSFIYINMIADMCVEMTAIKDTDHETQREGQLAAAGEMGIEQKDADAERSAVSRAQSVAGCGASC